MKWLLAMMSKGTDASEFFPDVVRNVIVKSVEVKKMVYMYLVRYADANAACREMSLLSINSCGRRTSLPRTRRARAARARRSRSTSARARATRSRATACARGATRPRRSLPPARRAGARPPPRAPMAARSSAAAILALTLRAPRSALRRPAADPRSRCAVMRVIRVPDIIQIQMLAVRKCAADSSPYVRRCAANAAPKLSMLDREQVEPLAKILDKLLRAC